MTPKRRTALQLGLLAVVMAAAAMLFVAGPACGPAAPGGQASGQVEPDATAEADGHGHHRRNEHAGHGTLGYRGGDQHGYAGNHTHRNRRAIYTAP